MSMTFTKLFSSITESTIWVEDDGTRLVWITMLAMADRNGRVFGSIPGLANRARVSVDATRGAITKFLSPDPDSRTKDFEGRRIEEIDGGWRLLNHEKYRELRDDEVRKLQNREAKRRQRKKSAPSLTVSQGQPPSAHAEAETDSDTESNPLRPAEQIYAHYPRKQARGAALKAIEKALAVKTPEFLLERTLAFGAATTLWPQEDRQFIPHPATWFNEQRYDDDPATWKRTSGNGTGQPNARSFSQRNDYSKYQA